MKKRYLAFVFLLLCIVSLLVGVKDMDIQSLLAGDPEAIELLLVSRIPRLISIIVVGAGMSIGGLIMQQLTQNKFVSPSTAATIDSAKLGLIFALIVMPGVGTLGKLTFGFIFALLGTFLFMFLLKKIHFKNAIFIPLIGIMLGNIIDSIGTFFAYKYDLLQNINTWMQGDFSMIVKGRYELLYFGIPLLILVFVFANKFTVAGMGEEFSKSLGLNYQKVVNIGLSLVAMVTALVVVVVGEIPFLGLIIPNLVALYKGDHLKNTLWDTALLGATFLILCDILGRVIIFPYEIPIGTVVGVIGSVIFLYLLFRGEKRVKS